MKRHNSISWFACLIGLSVFAHSQAVPTATRGGAVQLGGGVSYIKPDYGEKSIKGASIYGTFDFTQHIGIEGDIHFSALVPGDIAENSYLLGARYVFNKKRYHPYGKFLVGIASFTTQFDNLPNSTTHYKIYAFGGGLDIKATRKINIRAFDFEDQTWPTFSPNNLGPYVITVGAAYNFR